MHYSLTRALVLNEVDFKAYLGHEQSHLTGESHLAREEYITGARTEDSPDTFQLIDHVLDDYSHRYRPLNYLCGRGLWRLYPRNQ